MSHSCALVFCVHHKPWLLQSTLITTLLQDYQGMDLHFAHNLGNGDVSRPSYGEYVRLAGPSAVNGQLSAYDGRVREVCRLNRGRTTTIEYENDHALDSGAWYKFIREGRWRAYDYTAFFGEGTLLTRRNSLSAMLAFAQQRGVHFIGSGHEKRRLPKGIVMQYRAREHDTVMDRYQDRMIKETFGVFCRDPDFKIIYDNWGSDFPPETQNHVPDIWPTTKFERGLRARIQRRWGSPFTGNVDRDARVPAPAGQSPWLTRVVASAPYSYDQMAARASIWLKHERLQGVDPRMSRIHVNAIQRKLEDVVQVENKYGVRFHRADEPEWFAGVTIHMFSRTFLERLSAKLERFSMYDVLDLPFSATALELIWGFMPAWLGVEKWFTDGIHRVRKNFVTFIREDYPPEITSYINRYHRGHVCLGWRDDYLKIQALRPELTHLQRVLPSVYFA